MKKTGLAFLVIFFLCSGCRSMQVQSMETPAPGISGTDTGSAETGPAGQSSLAEPSSPADINPAELSDQAESPSAPEADAGLPVSVFNEIWAYLINGSEEALLPEYPVSDLGYFGAELDSYGHLINVPDPKKISFFKGRVHLVVACNGRALTHFVLMEGSRERKQLIADLLEAAKPFDGINIDFEYVPQKDGSAFLSFIKELRKGLKGKMLSIAVPARTRTLRDDVYDYGKLKDNADRILVMAYDEHWSGSEPGPIASMGWCRQVARYSLDTIGVDKLIMGLPFYGRSWGDFNPNRAFFNSGIERIKSEQGITEVNREDSIPTFSYQTVISITVYYEDELSLTDRLQMYLQQGVIRAGFWCLGQEAPGIWPLLKLSAR